MSRRLRRSAAGLGSLIAAGAAVAACSSTRPARAAQPVAAPATTVAATTTSTSPTTVAPTTVAPTTTPPTTDPGSLPQTGQLPSASDPTFQARMNGLWQAIVTGNAALAGPAFFPLSAYIQVKGISDPVHDYQTRLIPDYDQDIATLHAEIPASATFTSVSVPDAAQWILPGVEYNKGSYWRVYGTQVHFSIAGQAHYFTVASMISWRGQWYVVHLLSIR